MTLAPPDALRELAADRWPSADEDALHAAAERWMSYAGEVSAVLDRAGELIAAVGTDSTGEALGERWSRAAGAAAGGVRAVEHVAYALAAAAGLVLEHKAAVAGQLAVLAAADRTPEPDVLRRTSVLAEETLAGGLGRVLAAAEARLDTARRALR